MVSLIFGIILVIAGILFFSERNILKVTTWHVAGYDLNRELLGFLLFLAGIILMVVYFIKVVKPALLSPGMG